MESALIVATVAVPLHAALLNGWMYALHRREHEALAFAVSALAMAGIAGGLVLQSLAEDPALARWWQSAQLAAGAVLVVSFVRWMHAFFGLRRPLVEVAALAAAALTGAGIATDVVFEQTLVLRPALPFHPPAWNAPLTPAGQALVSTYVVFIAYQWWELLRASRRDPDVRPVFVSYTAFAGTLLYDAGRGAGLADGPELLPFGYLGMVVGISAVLISRFVRSMRDSARLAAEWHERVEERSAMLRRKEMQLVHGERLAMLGTLAAGVAHEINDPMAFVSSNLNRVEEAWADPQERGDVPEILAECRDGLARLRATVAELLRLARGSDARSLPVDLTEIVASVLPLVRGEARWRARLECELAPVPAVLGNPGLLAQVALQLLLNGIRAVPEEQTARHRVRVATRYEPGRVVLQVRDDGPPLPPELLPHLFDPFASLAVAGADGAAGGARLGLAVTHQIVTSHGGQIDAVSGRDGTVVTVSLPALEAAEAGVRAA